MKKRAFSISLSAITLLSIAAAAVASVSVCIAVFASMYSSALLRDARVSAEQAVGQTALAVNHYVDSMKQRLTAIRARVEAADSPGALETQLAAMTEIEDDIYAVTVYGADGAIVSCIGSGAARKSDAHRDLSFDRSRMESDAEFALSAPHVQTLFRGEYPWVVTLSARTSVPVLGSGCYVAIDFRFSEIAKYVDHVGVGRRGYCFLIDPDGGMVYHPQQQLLFSGLKTEDTARLAAMADGVQTIAPQQRIYALQTTEDGTWRVVGVSFTDELAAERRTQIVTAVAVSFLCCALIALIAMLVYSRTVTAQVQALLRAMKQFEADADHFAYAGSNGNVTELREISDTFGQMSAQLQALMAQIRREQTALRKTELRALQAQINPHFLYNTLDSIQWMCERGNTEDAAKMVSALARLFRISISRGKELIPIRDEMRHAQSYLVIQSYRYRNQFTYRFDVDPALEDYLCNKITVQPLIENAIYHGLNRLVDEGEIVVSVQRAPDGSGDILMTVSDNGVGMTDEQCRAILQKERSDSHGIGVKNVNDRLKIYFGDRYGITIRSELDVGTAVTVRIPCVPADSKEANV